MGEEDVASESDVVDPAASRATGRSPAFDLAHQLWLCTWKNLKLRGNRPVATILEIVCPLVAFVALTVLAPRNDYFDAPYAPSSSFRPPGCVLHADVPDLVGGASLPDRVPWEADIRPTRCAGAGALSGPTTRVHFAPDTDATRALMRAACEIRYSTPGVEMDADPLAHAAAGRALDHFTPRGVDAGRSPWPACTPEGHADEATMLEAIAIERGFRSDDDDFDFGDALGVAFDARFGAADVPPASFAVRARADADAAASELHERLLDALVEVLREGSIAVPAWNETTAPRVVPRLHRVFPLEPIYPTSTFAFVARFLPLAVTVSWTYTLVVCAGSVAGERERGLEAAMRAMGVRLSTHWAGHWIACMLLLGCAALFCGGTTTSFGAALFVSGDPALIFLLLFLAACAAVSGTFLVASLSPDASVASTAAATVWLVSYLPYAVVSSPGSRFDVASGVPAFVVAAACAPPSSALGVGLAAMAQWEAAGVGASWSNLWTTPPANAAGDVGVPLGAAMLLLSCGAVGLVAAAAGARARAFGRATAVSKPVGDGRVGGPVALVASGLRREYSAVGDGSPRVALESLDLVCPVDEITVLLGHNGAGKSSAIGCLVGAARPTRGRATVGGFDATSHEARQLLGFCPQHDALWDDLTVQDHLDFVLRLRGVRDDDELKRVRAELLLEVELRAKRHTRAGSLSGGMRRRLSVALAFAGDPPHVILDEPTAGVDPRARRQIQNLLLRKSRGRAVLVTTHHLDEAERLATRVAVLHRGRLACAGSARELKERYDAPHRLIVTLDGDVAVDRSAAADEVLRALRVAVPEARREGAEGDGEVTICVPGSRADALPKAIRSLTDASSRIGVAGFGLAAPSLDGVFRAVAAEFADEEDETSRVTVLVGEKSDDAPANAKEREPHDERNSSGSRRGSRRASRRSSFSASWAAVAYARLLVAWRDPSRMVATLVAPTLLLCSAAAMSGFPTLPREYALDPHLTGTSPGDITRAVDAVPTFACAAGSSPEGAGLDGAGVAPPWTTLRSSAAARGVRLDWLGPSAATDARCLAEAAVWERVKRDHPSGLRSRGTSEYVALALGAGSRSNASDSVLADVDARAETVWSSSSRASRRATALLTVARVDRALAAAPNATVAEAVAVSVSGGANRPWRKTRAELRRSTLASGPGPATAAAAALLAASAPPCLAAASAARDRAMGARRVLFVAGMPRGAHWLGVIATDALFAMASVALGAAAFASCGMDALGAEGVSRASTLLLAHAFAALAAAHLVATTFCEDAASALSTCLVAGALPSSFLVGLTYALDAVGADAGVSAVSLVGRAFPGYSLAQGLLEVSLRRAMGDAYVAVAADVDDMLTAMLVVGALAAVGVFVADASAGVRAAAEACVSSEVEIRKLREAAGEMDADVAAEERRVREASSEDGESTPDAVRLLGLNKVYIGKDAPAVRDLWLGVPPGECFGLLGINGCGKTTTFRMAAGDLPPTRGAVRVSGGGEGYCPQKDALWPTLTVAEHLRVVAAARGATDAAALVHRAIRDVGLSSFADVRAAHLSGGNRRKLCLASALLGLPRGGLALLDEPTAGVDPRARDAITETIRAAAEERRCAVIVTSHSVEDISALCRRVGVMVDGAMLCIGSPQRLRTKHGKHLALVAHRRADGSRETSAAELDAFVRSLVPDARRCSSAGRATDTTTDTAARTARASPYSTTLVETEEETAAVEASARNASDAEASLAWELPASAASRLPDILDALEGACGSKGTLEGYSLGQATLEDVFLEFAARGREQSDADLMAREDALFAFRKSLTDGRR